MKGAGGTGISPTILGIGSSPGDPCYQKYLCGGGGGSGGGAGTGAASLSGSGGIGGGGAGDGGGANSLGGSTPSFCTLGVLKNAGANTGGGGGGSTNGTCGAGGSGVIIFSY